MSPSLLPTLLVAVAFGGGLGFVIGRFLGGGWLFGFNLLLSAGTVLFLTSPLLEAIGIPRAGGEHMAYAALAVFVLLPALGAAVIFGGIGLWRAARARSGDREAPR